MAFRSNGPFPAAAVILVALVWFGMLVGISFLATPIKFQAPSLELPVALEVGHVTFAAFSKVEWGLALLLTIAIFFQKAARAAIAFSAIAVIIIVVQSLWLLPILDARIAAVIAGHPMPRSMHHMLYATLEGAKAAALVGVALVTLCRLGWRTAPRPQRSSP